MKVANRYMVSDLSTYLLISLVLLLSFQNLPSLALPSYEKSNNSVQNIQVSSPFSSPNIGATDKRGQCTANAAYSNDRSESWLAINPANPDQIVGMSKFFYDPTYYLFHVGSYVSNDGGKSWSNTVIPGFDCISAPGNSWVDTTDPVFAFDSSGKIYSAMLPFSFTYNSANQQVWNVVPNSAIFVVSSNDGLNWSLENNGKPLAIYTSSGLGRTADKQWIAVDDNPLSPFKDNIYVGWTVFNGFSSEVWFSRSVDHGKTFSQPVMLSKANNSEPFNTFVFLGTAPDGSLYIVYTSFPSSTFPRAQIWLMKSTDGGQTFSKPILATEFNSFPFLMLPNTTFRDGISDSFAVSPVNGHLFIAMEVYNGKGLDVQLIESKDGGITWSNPIYVNDQYTVDDGTDQFQPTVSVSKNGIVAVTFFDRRLPCPLGDPNILPADQGRRNFCIDVSVQFYRDDTSLNPIGSNIRATKNSWDPQQPGSAGLPRPGGPNGAVTFIGDYFGLALSDKVAYILFVSTYNYGLNPKNDQQQFLAIVPIQK